MSFLKNIFLSPRERTARPPSQLLPSDKSQTSLIFKNQSVIWKKRAGKKNLTLKIEPAPTVQGCKITVTSPIRTAAHEILSFLTEKQDWIEKTSLHLQSLKSRIVLKEIKSGETFPLLGYQMKLELRSTDKKKISWQKNFSKQILECQLPAGDWTHEERKKMFFQSLKQFYFATAENYLKQRLPELSQITELSYKRMSLRAQRSRWGSCSSNGTISLNYKMILLSPSLIDYILIHELCHTKHMNHSRDFWSLVEHFFPSYLEAERLLKEQQNLTHFLNHLHE